MCDRTDQCGCVCDNGWTAAPDGTEDCSCSTTPCATSCQPPFGNCECNKCTCNTTYIDSLPCTVDCGAGECVKVVDKDCGMTMQCSCPNDPANPVPVTPGECPCMQDAEGKDLCGAANCFEANSVNCTARCGVCECKPGVIGDSCLCDPGTEAPACDSPCLNGGSCVPSAGKRDPVTGALIAGCVWSCQCVPPFSGPSCADCDVTNLDCPLACRAQTCGDCFLDSGSTDPRLQEWGWCVSDSGNSSCIKRAECSAGNGVVVDACPVAPTPAPTLLENKSVFYGGIAAAAVLILAILAMIIYKIFIWKRDKQLWAKFNAQQDWGLDANPLYKDAFDQHENPIYAENADVDDRGAAFF